jgi:tRNA 2-thiouridine synthesizing protein D
MRFTLIIQCSPYAGTAVSRALETASLLLAEGHVLERLFFYQDGVYNASSKIVPPQHLDDHPLAWNALIEQHQLDAVVCVSSALHRGILNDSEAGRYEKGQGTMLPGFTLGGLGLLVDAINSSDRVLTFG